MDFKVSSGQYNQGAGWRPNLPFAISSVWSVSMALEPWAARSPHWHPRILGGPPAAGGPPATALGADALWLLPLGASLTLSWPLLAPSWKVLERMD